MSSSTSREAKAGLEIGGRVFRVEGVDRRIPRWVKVETRCEPVDGKGPARFTFADAVGVLVVVSPRERVLTKELGRLKHVFFDNDIKQGGPLLQFWFQQQKGEVTA